ncbi:MAG: FHA domain-containing protein [Vicinamibacterales bacterium]|nr:FHA domain-containing protein [Vicinamibacterales bacterium]
MASLLGGSVVPRGGTMIMGAVSADAPGASQPAAPKFSARLVVRGDTEASVGEAGDVLEIRGSRVIIGRSAESGIQIDHPSVSTSHAEIREREGRYQLCDLGSTNGTWVNDDQVSGVPLKDGSRITVGSSRLLFTRLSSAAIRPGVPGLGSQRVLLVQSGPSAGRNFPVGDQPLVIGQEPGEGGTQLQDQTVAPRHALLRPTPERPTLFDLGTVEGTKVDDVDVVGTALANGDVIRLGLAELEFVSESPA